MQGPSVVVIDDDLGILQLIGDILRADGARVTLARGGDEGIAVVKRSPPDVLFVDLRLPGRDGIAIIEEVRRFQPHLPIVVLTGFGSFESSVEALRLGVSDYVTKPVTAKKISQALSRAMACGQRQRESQPPASDIRSVASGSEPEKLVATSVEMREVLELAERIARVAVPVLIEGETGVGKESIARFIHRRSSRSSGPFVRATPAAVREDQLERALFGQNSAGHVQTGVLEQASGGTLLLHNVSDLPCWIQGQLLEVLQQGWFTRPGSDERVSIDVRVIATTSVPLQAVVARGQFNQGLYYFLSVMPIVIPPLRKRREDIQALIEHFVDELTAARRGTLDTSRIRFSKESLNCLMDYHWPGNVQELANVVKRSVLLATGDEIALTDFPEVCVETPPPASNNSITVPLSGDLKNIERYIIAEVLKRCHGNKAATARALGLHRKTLYRLLEPPSETVNLPDQTPQPE